jgi:hypothetical protein
VVSDSGRRVLAVVAVAQRRRVAAAGARTAARRLADARRPACLGWAASVACPSVLDLHDPAAEHAKEPLLDAEGYEPALLKVPDATGWVPRGFAGVRASGLVELVSSAPREAVSERAAPEVWVLPAVRRGGAPEPSDAVSRQAAARSDAWALPVAQPLGQLCAAPASEPDSPAVWAPAWPAHALRALLPAALPVPSDGLPSLALPAPRPVARPGRALGNLQTASPPPGWSWQAA